MGGTEARKTVRARKIRGNPRTDKTERATRRGEQMGGEQMGESAYIPVGGIASGATCGCNQPSPLEQCTPCRNEINTGITEGVGECKTLYRKAPGTFDKTCEEACDITAAKCGNFQVCNLPTYLM